MTAQDLARLYRKIEMLSLEMNHHPAMRYWQDKLNALLPREETLEEVVEEMLSQRLLTIDGAPITARLRAALARSREGR